MITTASWSQKENWRGALYQISTRPMPFARKQWGRLEFLFPTRDMVLRYRSGGLTQEKYTELYWKLIQDRWPQVKEWLDSLAPEDDITLLCFEREGQFCHRRLVAELVRRHRPDIPIDEH